MLRRKIESYLEEWKRNSNHKPLVIKGVRQCGKTYSVQQFVKAHYNHFVYVDFVENPDFKEAFYGAKTVDTIIMNLSAIIENAKFIPNETCLIFDELQDCPEARTSLKYFKMDGRYDVICTGSLLGVKGYGSKNKRKEKDKGSSVPVGYETIVEMFPLDFEDFLWANGINEEIIALLKKHFETETPVTAAIHKRTSDLLRQYAVVGGMPEAVNTFISTHDISQVVDVQRGIIDEYKDDMVKYADDSFKNRIRECFESIPKQLSKENKKFQYSVIKKGGRAAQYYESLQWIEDAGIAKRCYNLSVTELPLDGNAKEDVFKVYMQDTGLFLSMLEYGTQADVLKGNLLGYKGAIYENFMADILSKMGRKLYYFHKDSGLEVDFVIRYKGKCTLLEVKASSGNVKSTKTILKHPEVYHVTDAIKLGDYNIGRDGQLLTLPFYMGFLLTEV